MYQIQTDHAACRGRLEFDSQINQLNCNTNSAFMKYLRHLFDIIDADHQGFIRVDELKTRLKSHDFRNTLAGVSDKQNLKLITALNQVAPVNGLVNFKRFILAINIALNKVPVDPRKGIGRTLRPKSFLFAVTESSENETDSDLDVGRCKIANSRHYMTQNSDNETKKHEDEVLECAVHEGMADPSEPLEQKIQEESERLLLLKRSIDETEKLRDCYNEAIMEVKSEKKNLKFLSAMTEAELEGSKTEASRNAHLTCISKISTHITNIFELCIELKSHIKNGIEDSNFNRMVSKLSLRCLDQGSDETLQEQVQIQSDKIQKLEKDKAALVKELFYLKSQMKNPGKQAEQLLPF